MDIMLNYQNDSFHEALYPLAGVLGFKNRARSLIIWLAKMEIFKNNEEIIPQPRVYQTPFHKSLHRMIGGHSWGNR